jgi:hypothetical protein
VRIMHHTDCRECLRITKHATRVPVLFLATYLNHQIVVIAPLGQNRKRPLYISA